MSLRDLVKGERLKIQLALNQAKAGGMTRGSLLGGLGGMGGLGLREKIGSRVLATRGANPGTPMEQPNSPMPEQPFQPKLPKPTCPRPPRADSRRW